ncbi:MAG: helix-turn-helix domain-containing protein [Clostridia bacterium]|nr:helix-turn-helix domain-containing protein [Clostridia bacterium]
MIDKTADQNDERLIFYTTKDIAQMLGCSIPTARKLFYRKDGPAVIRVGKNYKVERRAFEAWCREKHV